MRAEYYHSYLDAWREVLIRAFGAAWASPKQLASLVVTDICRDDIVSACYTTPSGRNIVLVADRSGYWVWSTLTTTE